MTKKVVKHLIYCEDSTCGCVQEIEKVNLICPECGEEATFEASVQEVEDDIKSPGITRFRSRTRWEIEYETYQT